MDKTVEAYMEDYERSMYYLEMIMEEQDLEVLKKYEKKVGVDEDLTSVSRMGLTTYLWQRIFIIEHDLMLLYTETTNHRVYENGIEDIDMLDIAKYM